MIKTSYAMFVTITAMMILTWYFNGIMDEYHIEKMNLQKEFGN